MSSNSGGASEMDAETMRQFCEKLVVFAESYGSDSTASSVKD